MQGLPRRLGFPFWKPRPPMATMPTQYAMKRRSMMQSVHFLCDVGGSSSVSSTPSSSFCDLNCAKELLFHSLRLFKGTESFLLILQMALLD